MVFRAPVFTEEFMKVDDVARLSVLCPKRMTAPHSDPSADLGCRRYIPIYECPLLRVRIVEIRDILALYWCPGVVVFPL